MCSVIHCAVMAAPESYVKWMNAHPGFNPRDQKSSNALSEFVVQDLRKKSRKIDKALSSGSLYEIQNAKVPTPIVIRNIDLVFSANAANAPVDSVIAVEHKT